ncbi:flagellar biosynthetic protein FliO [Ferrimonas sediminicola]|uniref:Flagellar protein n=1 Tax=Ferrimonas sediminicola TaxID=2569538 RepID=A0A4V5NXR7_9GAMM|nr:flagellar biosynthetic protein FliO [Ferrimonas sediminicola]TKB47233.1 flagellar biosynthetic protein FliO [Ferrimonas sediminicola]
MRYTLLPLLWLSLPLAAEPISSGEQLATTIATLVGVVALILVLALAARKMNLPTKLVGKIRLIASLPLGTKERVAVIQVGEQQYLIGVSGGGIQLLDKLESPIEGPQGGEFAKVLAKVGREPKS